MVITKGEALMADWRDRAEEASGRGPEGLGVEGSHATDAKDYDYLP